MDDESSAPRGIPPAYLVMTNVRPEDWCVAITEQRKTIGRCDKCDVRVSPRFRHVSREHAEIWAESNAIKIRDLGSTCGTHINGVWVSGSREANAALGDRIWIGGLDLEITAQISTLAQVLAETGSSADEAAEAEDTMIRRVTAPIPAQFVLNELSQAELELVLWISRGYVTDQEIGKKLFRSPNTVRTQVSSIFRKLKVNSRAQIVAFLRRGK